eukprot:5287632-Pyramimonas_sp.AAC.1
MHALVQRVERHRRRNNVNVQVQQLSESAKKLVHKAPAGVHELFPFWHWHLGGVGGAAYCPQRARAVSAGHYCDIVGRGAGRGRARVSQSLRESQEWVGSTGALGTAHKSIEQTPAD